MRKKGQGSASISAVVVFLSALIAIGLMATILSPVADVLSGFREGLKERAERGSELVRIYIHSMDETEGGRPIITIINGYDRESILTDYVVVARNGRILTAGKMGGSLSGIRLAPGARIDLTPADFGLSYPIFAAMADEVKAIYIRTAEGNSFGSSYGPPPSISYGYQIFVSRRTSNIIITGSTSSLYSITISPTLPTLGNALVVRNVILVDKDGFVRGGAQEGSRWSDGSFNPNAIPDSVAALAQTDIIPMGSYYYVPSFPKIVRDFDCFSVYSNCDTKPWYLEMVEFYPVEIYSPGSPVVATAYYARFPGEVQTVYRDGEPVVVNVQRPLKDWTYPYGVPGSFVTTVAVAYASYGATVTSTTINMTTTTITSGWITRTNTVTYNYTVTTLGTIWPEGGQVKFAPVFVPVIYGGSGGSSRLTRDCIVYFGPEGGTKTCSFTINPPAVDPRSNVFILTSIKTFSYSVSKRYWGSCDLNPKPAMKVENVSISGPWGTLILKRDWLPDIYGYLPVGSVNFTLVAKRDPCPGWYSSMRLIATVIYTFVRNEIATATIYNTNNFQIDFQKWIQQAIGAGSGNAVVHMAGTVEGGRAMKIRAPIVLLNYVYRIAGGPPTSPPPSGGGGSTVSDVVQICDANQYEIINPSPPSSNSPPSPSSDSPLPSISGGTVADFGVGGNTVLHIREVVCRPVPLSR